MGYKEFGFGGFAGLSGNMLSIASAAEDLSSLSSKEQEKHTEYSNNLAISSGSFGVLTNVLGLIDILSKDDAKLSAGMSDENAQKVKRASKAEQYLGATEGILGMLFSGTGIIGGIAGRCSMAGLQKGMGITSGVLNITGGAFEIGKTINSFKKYKETGKTENASKSLIMGSLGGVGKIFSGITGAGSAANPENEEWKKANVASAGLGCLIGLVDTGIYIKDAVLSSKSSRVGNQNQNQNAP